MHLHFEKHLQAFVGGLPQKHSFTAFPLSVQLMSNLAFFLLPFFLFVCLFCSFLCYVLRAF